MFVKTSHSTILKVLQSNQIGLWEADSVGVLFGLRMVAVLAVFQMLG